MFHGLCKLNDHLFAVAHHDRIHERRDRLRIAAAGTAANDERHVFAAIRRAERYAGKIQHGQDVGIAHLIQQRKAYDVELAQSPLCFERKHGQLFGAELLFHVRPRRVHALTGDLRLFVQHMVKDARPQMRHADLIHIRKAHGKAQSRLVLHDLVPFAAKIARRLFYRCIQLVQRFLIEHAYLHKLPFIS